MEKFIISNRRYLGSKYKLLEFLDEIIKNNTVNCNSLIDIFGGTGVVGNYFSDKYDIIINDMLKSNYYVFDCFLGKEKICIDKLKNILIQYNKLKELEDNYYSINFSDTYLSKNNLKKVGYIRDDIDYKFKNNEINNRERAILITSLIYAVDRIANTVGHYDAYRKKGDLDKKLELRFPELKDNIKKVSIYNEDANVLVKKIKADICYLDPPYNSRQYCDAYHFLENITENKKPNVVGVAKKMDRSNLKSKYSMANARKSLAELIENLDTKYILLSYNNTAEKANARSNAKISDKDILEILNKKGKTKIFKKDFIPFNTGKTKIDNHEERVFFCEVGVFEKENNLSCLTDKEKIKVQSPLNYTGGKFKILDQISLKFPPNISTFYDVFCGGFNVGSNIQASKIVAIDKNKELINLLKYLKNTKYEILITKLEEKIEYYNLSNSSEYGYEYYNCNSSKGLGKYNKENFLKLRQDYNNTKDNLLFLLLIFYSFNNQIRFNKLGKFNLPVGKRDFNNNMKKKLKGFLHNLNVTNTNFICSDFRKIDITKIDKKTFFYLDPPYLLGQASYNENNMWNDIDDEELLNFLDKCNENGIRFALSNVIEHKGLKNNNLINWTIKNSYNLNYINCNYHNSNYQVKHKTTITKEVLITNY